jgi:serine/threonine protein kinase
LGVNESQVFGNALKCATPAERGAYLDEACAGNPQLRADVEALLRAHANDPGFLEQPPGRLGETTSEQPPRCGSTEQPGLVLADRFRLLEPIGEGGMGSVWLAQQTEPVKRLVAVKLIKPGMDSKAVLQRFEAERQALALMDHPNIARVLDAGAAPDGRPFFVLELVKGQPITTYCDQHRLTLRQRLELLVPVCQAIQHAHQKGIIHRDIKPSNVLVARFDDRPVPKVIDFGVAKATGQQLTEQTLQTGLGAVVGTPEYMSPEQAGLNPLDVDTRSDVYALGVLLYELLAGSPPFRSKELARAGLLEVLRVIREQEPPSPSTRLSMADELPALAASRGTEPRQLAALVRGELDWIVMKALEKERTRRYETALGLATDLRHYLADEPVQACPPSAVYRLRKFVRRNRVPVLAAALVLLALVGGVIGTSVGMVQAWRNEAWAREEAGLKETARLEAVQLGQKAQEQADIARSVNDLLLYDLLDQADIGNQPLMIAGLARKRNPSLTVRELLDRAAAKIEGKFTGKEPTEVAVRVTIGNAYHALGELAEAEKHLQRAIRLRAARLGAYHPDTLISTNNLAKVYESQRKYERAEILLKEVIAGYTGQLGAGHLHTLVANGNLAGLYWSQGKYNRAEALFVETLAGARAHLGPEHSLILGLQHGLALVYGSQGKYDRAEPLLKEVAAAHEARLGPDHPDTLADKHSLATLYGYQGRHKQAEALAQEVVATATARLGPKHHHTLTARHNLAHLYKDQGKYDRAEVLFKEVVAAQSATLGADHPDTLTGKRSLSLVYRVQGKYEQAGSLLKDVVSARTTRLGAAHPHTLVARSDLASLFEEQGSHGPAEALFQEVIAAQTAALGADHPDTLTSRSGLGRVYSHQGRYDQAAALAQEVLTARSATLGAEHSDTLISKNNLAIVYYKLGRLDEAVVLHREVLAVQAAGLVPDHPNTLSSKDNLAQVYLEQRKLDLAEPLLREVLAARTARLGAGHLKTLLSKNNLATLFLDRMKYVEAEALLTETAAGSTALLGADHPDTLTTRKNLARAYQGQGKLDEAELLFKEVLAGWKARQAADHPHALAVKLALAALYRQQKRFGPAEALLQEALDGYAAASLGDHPVALAARATLGVWFWERGNLNQSAPLFEDLLCKLQQRQGPQHLDTLKAAYNLAANYRDARRLPEALTVIREWLPRGREKLGMEGPVIAFGVQTALSIYDQAGAYAEAEPLLRDIAEFWKGKAGAGSLDYGAKLGRLGVNLLLQEKAADAELMLRRSLEISRVHQPDDWTTYNVQSLLGESLLQQKKFNDAEPQLKQGYEGLKQREARMPPSVRRPRLTAALERLVRLYEAWGREDQAASWRRQLDSYREAGNKSGTSGAK